MSFDVFIIESSASPPKEQFKEAVRKAVIAGGGVEDAQGNLATSDGFAFELFGSMFALRGWSDSMGELLFAVAELTSSYIYPVGEDSTALRTPNNKGAPPDGLGEISDVADAAEMCRGVAPDFYGWASYRDYVRQK